MQPAHASAVLSKADSTCFSPDILACLNTLSTECIHRDHAFVTATAHIWNALPSTVSSAAVVNSFKKHLKTHLHVFHCSFPSPHRQQLRSSSSTALVLSRTCRATIGGRSFSAAATSVWNSLPEAVRSSTSLAVFRKTLKTELFSRSYID